MESEKLIRGKAVDIEYLNRNRGTVVYTGINFRLVNLKIHLILLQNVFLIEIHKIGVKHHRDAGNRKK